MSIKYSLFFLPLLLFVLSGCKQPGKKQSVHSEEGILLASAPDAGMDSIIINKIDTAIRNGTYPNIHSLLIAKGNHLIYENYWPGKDEIWGDSIGFVAHAKDSLHDIRSISKSVVSACIGIAIKQGKIKSVDQVVFEFFPEYAEMDTGTKSSIAIKHLLAMSSGLVWNEDIPYDDPQNSEIRMANSPNQVKYVLSQPMEIPPGTSWKYNGGTTQLLAAIIEKTSGKKIDEFASEYLFQPLGIMSFQWIKYPGTDLPAAASGLRLRSRDLLKFALMYNQGGSWQGKEILDSTWVKESFQSHIEKKGGGYGYQFWLWKDYIDGEPIPIVACVGNGDQRIIFDKTRDLVMVITAGNYNKWTIEKDAYALIRDFIYPALIKK